MTVEIELDESEVSYIVRVLEAKLRRLRRKLRVLERELRRFEERYGVSTEEFMGMYQRVEGGGGGWMLPEEADMDAIEWYGLALARAEVVEEIESIEKIVSKLRRGA